VTPNVFNIDGYVVDVDVNDQLHIDLSKVSHDHGVVTLTTDQLWMTDVGKLAGKPLAAFKGAVDPRKWDTCPATKPFFVNMEQVQRHKGWPKVIDETVRLIPTSPASDVTTRLEFGYEATEAIVATQFDLVPGFDPPGGKAIVVDNGFVKATKLRANVTDVNGVTGDVDFFRFTSQKQIKFADGRRLPDGILTMLWGWGAVRHVDCAG